MPPPMNLVASEILICGLRGVPLVGLASQVVESIRRGHEILKQADGPAAIEGRLPPFDRERRDRVVEEIRSILGILGRPGLGGSALAGLVRRLRQLQGQGWSYSLFAGLFLHTSHWEGLMQDPQRWGCLLEPHDWVDLGGGIHVLLDIGETRILELTPFAFAQLLAHQARGIPDPRIRVAEGVWAFPDRDPTRPGDSDNDWTSWSCRDARNGIRIKEPLEIPREVHDAMVAHCRREAPLMACGLLGGLPPRVSSFHALRNAAASESRHDADPRDLLKAVVALRDRGAEILAIYHSNPRWEAVPSLADLRENHYGSVPRIIVSLLGEAPTARVWRLDADSYQELPWRIV